MKLTKAARLFALALVVTAPASCGVATGGDKAGGPAGGPVVLRMASTASDLSGTLPVAYFIQRVRALSGGAIRIQVVSQSGLYAPSAEAQVVHAVAAGRADLGWTGNGVFDTIGVPTLRALSAPMLIGTYPLENAVLRTAIPRRMLAGLNRVHVTGLAVLGDGLGHPIAVRAPLLGPAGWRGLSIGTYPSGLQERAIRALGATPVVAFGPNRAHYLATGQIAGFDLDVQRYALFVQASAARYVTGNVALWPLFDVLFANPARLGALTGEQRAWIWQAAAEAAAGSVSLVAGREAQYIRRACAMGSRFATAAPADMAALLRAFAPVYRSLDADPQARAFISRIRQLKNATPPGPGLAIPAGCATPP